jgi:hypothetical protein
LARQANGQYLQPANTAAISGQTISSTAFNTLVTDIGIELTNSLDRGGRSAMTAALPMGGQKITGMAEPTLATDGATKNYVDTTTATFFGTGDIKLTIKTVADAGWSLFLDQTIGSGASGANENGSQYQALFTLIFNNISDAASPIFTSGGGATTRAGQTNAASAWAANCRISLPKTLGRALAVAGSGSGLTARALGSTAGAETATLGTANLPPYTPTGTNSVTTLAGGKSMALYLAPAFSSANGTGSINTAYDTAGPTNITFSTTLPATTFTGTAQGGTSTAFSIMQPATFLNAMIKQ